MRAVIPVAATNSAIEYSCWGEGPPGSCQRSPGALAVEPLRRQCAAATLVRNVALKDPAILQHTLDEAERRVLSDLVSRLRTHYGDRLERVTVFGSRARGDVSDGSDIDVLVVLRIPLADEGHETNAAWELLDLAKGQAPNRHVPISMLVFSEARYLALLARERRFALDIEAEGISL